jgi:hypothetical protein
MKTERWANDQEALGFLHEAERIVDAPSTDRDHVREAR